MEGAPAPQEDFSSLSIEDRLAHKVWKARLSAYEDLQKAFSVTPDEDDPVFTPYVRNPDLLKKIVTDSNAVAHEKGVECLSAFLKFGGRRAGSTREVVLPSVVDKCLGSTRAGTKKHGLEVVLLYVEMEDKEGSEGPVNDVIEGLKAKQPKVVAGAVTALKEMIGSYGHKAVKIQLILKQLPKVFGHSDKNVRAEGALLCQGIYRFIGPAIQPALQELKPVQVKELTEQFEALDAKGEGAGKGTPTRYLASQRAAMEAAAAAASSGGGGEDGEGGGDEGGAGDDGKPEELDAFDFAEPAEIKLPEGFHELVASKKWQERKEALEAVLNSAKSSPKIKPEDGGRSHDDLVRIFAERVKGDSNINVVLIAVNCIEAFAKGLREGFAKYKSVVVPPMIEKLKERKANVIEALSNALDGVFMSVTLSDVLEDILAATKHKNPQVKAESIKWLVRCLKITRQPPAKGDIKTVADALLAAIDDGAAPVRDSGAEGLGCLMKVVGERQLAPFVEGLDDIKKAKVKEQFEKAVVKYKPTAAAPPKKPASAPRTAAAPVKKVVKKPTTGPPAAKAVDKENNPPNSLDVSSPAPSKPGAKPPAKFLGKKPAAATTAAPSAAAKKVPAGGGGAKPPPPPPKGGSSASEPVKYRFSQEDAEARAAELIPSEITAGLASSAWKERVAGMEALELWLEGGQAEVVESEVIVRALAKKPGWKESNFQVLSKVYNVLSILAQKCPTFGKSSIAISVQPLCDKLGDLKLKQAAGETLMVFAEKTSLGFVLIQAFEPMSKQKAPKVQADSLLWIEQALREFGITGVPIRDLIEFLKTNLKSSNAAVRSNATKTLVTLKLLVGSDIMTFITDLNPQLLSTIESEFAKVEGQSAPTPTRTSADNAAPRGGGKGGKAGAGGGGAGGGGGGGDALDDLFPRQDLDKLVSSATVSRLNNANWKERKEALEEIEATLESHKRLKPNMTELTVPLKSRLTDSNKAVQVLALGVVARIATGMNKPFEKYAKNLTPGIVAVLADQKAHIRAAGISAIAAIAEQCGVDPMVTAFATGLEGKGANPALRKDLLSWLAGWFEEHHPNPSLDLAPLAGPIIVCLEDKSGDVRKAAQALLPAIIANVGYKHVVDQTSGLKAASRATVMPMIDAAKPAAAAMKPNGAATAPVAAAAPVARATSSAVSSSAPSPKPAGSGIAKPGLPRPGGLKAPSAVARSLKAPTSSLRPPDSPGPESTSGVGLPKSRIGGPGLKRPGVGLRPPAAAAPTVAAPAGDKSPLFVSADPKFKQFRAAKEGRAFAWVTEEKPRPDMTDHLRQQFEPCSSADLVSLLFSKDHQRERDYLSGLNTLNDCIVNPSVAEEEYGMSNVEMKGRFVANADLIFKYIALRFADNNTSMTVKCLDLLEHLIAVLDEEDYHIIEYEATCFLPCLIAKSGDPKEVFRVRIRGLFKSLCRVYPPSRMFANLLELGLPSKNARTRAESLEELGSLIRKNSLQVCTPSKAFPTIAALIADRDANVRTAALNTIGEGYKLIGDDVWGLVGKLGDKDKSLLTERLKRTEGPLGKVAASPRVSATPGRSTPVAPSPPGATSARFAGPASGIAASAIATPSRIGRSSAIPSRLARPSSVHVPAAGQPPKSKLPGLPRPARESTIPSPRGSLGSQDGRVTPSSPTRSQPRSRRGSEVSRPASRPASRMRSPTTSAYDGEDEHAAQQVRPMSGVSHAGSDAATVDSASAHEDLHRRRGTVDEAVQSASASGPMVDVIINEILSNDPNRSSEALKRIDRHIEKRSSSLMVHADQFVEAMAIQTRKGFDGLGSEPNSKGYQRLCKHLISTANSFFDPAAEVDGHALGSGVSSTALLHLLTEYLTRLIDASFRPDDEQAQTYSKYLNIIVLRSFNACSLNNLFSALFSMLREATEDMRELSEETLPKRAKFAELVVKCLWKISKRLPTSLEDGSIDACQLLVDVDIFLSAIPPAEWKRRAQDDLPLSDLPLRTVKVILTNYVQAFGEDVYDKLELIESPENSFIYPYLMRLLNDNAPAAAQKPTSPSEEDRPTEEGVISRPSSGSDAASTSAARSKDRRQSTISDEDKLHAELSAIFKKIANKNESRPAIRELYEFQKAHPHMNGRINYQLEETGPIFQRYIKRALANHAAEDEHEKHLVDMADAQDVPPASPVTGSRVSSGSGEVRPTPPRPTVAPDSKLAELHKMFNYTANGAGGPPREKKPQSDTEPPTAEALSAKLAAYRAS